MIKELTPDDAFIIETIASDIKGGLNAISAICDAMENGGSSAKYYASGLYFVYYALEEQANKLYDVIDVPQPEADQ